MPLLAGAQQTGGVCVAWLCSAVPLFRCFARLCLGLPAHAQLHGRYEAVYEPLDDEEGFAYIKVSSALRRRIIAPFSLPPSSRRMSLSPCPHLPLRPGH